MEVSAGRRQNTGDCEIAAKYEVKGKDLMLHFRLSDDDIVLGGKWLYFLKKDVDIKWRKLAMSLIMGELGSVLRIKVGNKFRVN